MYKLIPTAVYKKELGDSVHGFRHSKSNCNLIQKQLLSRKNLGEFGIIGNLKSSINCILHKQVGTIEAQITYTSKKNGSNCCTNLQNQKVYIFLHLDRHKLARPYSAGRGCFTDMIIYYNIYNISLCIHYHNHLLRL